MPTIRYNGRNVTRQWYNRYVLATRKRPPAPRKPVLVLFVMPAIDFAGVSEEVRLIDLRGRVAPQFVTEMSRLYSDLPDIRTTFFPNHP